MKKSLFISIIALSICVIVSAPPPAWADEQTLGKASQWIAEQKLIAEQELEEDKKSLREAEAVLSKAKSALNLAREYKDTEAIPIAEEAVATAQQAVNIAKRKLKTHSQAVSNLSANLKRAYNPDIPLLLPYYMQGDITVLGPNGYKQPYTATTVLKEGEHVQLAKDARLELITPDGHHVTVAPGSTWGYYSGNIKSLGKKLIYEIKSGWQHISNPPRPKYKGLPVVPAVRGANDEPLYHAATLVVAVRGTEFDEYVDEAGIGHIVPFSGDIDVIALDEEFANKQLNRWWDYNAGKREILTIPADTAGQITFVTGHATIKDSNGAERNAVAGEKLNPGDHIECGDNTIITIALIDNSKITLAANSRLDISRSKTGLILYALRSGKCYMWSGAQPTHYRLLTPNAVITPDTGGFALSVTPAGLADIVCISGKLSISAVADRVEIKLIDKWWGN